MVSYPIFMALFTLATIAGLIIGLYVFGDFRRLSKEHIIRGIRHNWIYVIPLVLVLLAILVENLTHDLVYTGLLNEANFTPFIKDISFDGALGLAIQRGLRSDAMDTFLTVIYIYSYVFVLFFTPFMFMVRDDRKRMKEYSLSISMTFAVLLPFYFLFAVETPSRSGLVVTEAILYNNENLLQLVKAVDPLDNCFPSGHIAVPFAVFFLLMPIRKHRQYLRYAIFMGSLCFLISLSVLYLGAHWVADIVSAVILAWFTVWLARKPKVMRWFEGWAERLRSKLEGLVKKDSEDV